MATRDAAAEQLNNYSKSVVSNRKYNQKYFAFFLMNIL